MSLPRSRRPTEGGPLLFAASFLAVPVVLSLMTLAKASEQNPGKTAGSLLQLFGPFVVGAAWVHFAKSRVQLVLRGALVGLLGGLARVVAIHFETRQIQHDDVLPLAILMLSVVMPFVGILLGLVCASITLAAFWVRRRGERVPF